MENITLIYWMFGVLLVLVLALLVYILVKLNKGSGSNEIVDEVYLLNEKLTQQLVFLKDELRDTARNLDSKLHEHQKDMGENVRYQFDKSQRLIQDITKELTEVKEGNKQVFSMTEQLTNLEKVLTNQKQRGNWGESSLELILSNILSTHFAMQYRFENGEAVDAVVYIKDKVLPIDSKFSLDNYQRCIDASNEEDRKFYAEEFKKDLKKRIEETSKYIREKENTLPIAFMFIPSEAIYYDLLAGENSRIKVNTQKLLEYAQKERVFIVSPTSILAYLHLVLSGIKAFTIEESAKQIQKKVEELGKHMNAYEEYYKKLGSSISTTVNHYNAGYKELRKIDNDVYKITEGEAGTKTSEKEIFELDRPKVDEE